MFAALAALALGVASVCAQNISTTSTCDTIDVCSIIGPYVSIWAWQPQTSLIPAGGVLFSGPTSTATLVTIVDEAQNRTTSSLQWPDNYTPATNSAGTRTMVLSYKNDDDGWTTVTATYPTPFVAWPSSYFWQPECTTGLRTETVSGNPQPSNSPDLLPAGMYIPDEEFEADPEGMGFLAASIFLGYWPWVTMSDLWPDQPPLMTCTDDDIGPNWAAFTSTAWYTVHSTMYTTGTTTESAIPKPTSSSQPTETSKTTSSTGAHETTGQGDGNSSGSSVTSSVQVIVSKVSTVVVETVDGKETKIPSQYDVTISAVAATPAGSGADNEISVPNSPEGVTTVVPITTVKSTTIDGKLTSYSTSYFITLTMPQQGGASHDSSTTLIAVPTELVTTLNGTPTSLSTTLLVVSTITSRDPITIVGVPIPTVVSTVVDGTPTSYSTTIYGTSVEYPDGTPSRAASSITTVLDVPTMLVTTIDGTRTSISTTLPVTTTIAEQSAGVQQTSEASSSSSPNSAAGGCEKRSTVQLGLTAFVAFLTWVWSQ